MTARISSTPSSHPALAALNGDQVAELAVLGLRYRALGAKPLNLGDSQLLSPYWTADRVVEAAVQRARDAGLAGSLHDGRAQGHIMALFNMGLISNQTYMEQFNALLQLPRGVTK